MAVEYVTLTEVKTHGQIDDDNRDALISAQLKRASRAVDRWTKVPTDGWSDLQGKTITTQMRKAGEDQYFSPLHIQSITSVTNDGVVLAEGPDDDFVTWPWFLERVRSGRFGREFLTHSGFTSLPQKLVIVGNFGYAAVDDDIKFIAAEAALIMAGLKRNTFETNEGVEASVLLTDMGGLAKDLIEDKKRRHNVEPFLLA